MNSIADNQATALPLRALLAEPLPATLKGLAPAAVGRPLSELGRLKLNVLAGDLPLPVAVLHEAALEHNARWMSAFVDRAGVSLAPHGKTTLAPQLFELQLRHGAWAITAATASHVRLYRRFGVQRVLMANQLVGRTNIALVLDELRADPGFDFYCLVDSLSGLEALTTELTAHPIGRPLNVLLEIGLQGGRTGVRSVEEGLALGRALRAASSLVALRGIEAFEGVIGGDDHRAELAVHGVLDQVCELARAGMAEGWFAPGEVILTAGGSAFFDLVAQVLAAVPLPRDQLRVVLRSGCYLSHDALHYERMQARLKQRAGALWGTGPGLRNAIEVWAYVQSVPEPRRAICGLGRRDVSFDVMLPQPLRWYRPSLHRAPQPVPQHLRTVTLFDQHAYVDAEGEQSMPWQVGDFVAFGIGHPCTTFDKWPLLHLVNDGLDVTGGIRTFF